MFPLIHILSKYRLLKFCQASTYKMKSMCLVLMICKHSLFWILKFLSSMCCTSIFFHFVAYFFILWCIVDKLNFIYVVNFIAFLGGGSHILKIIPSSQSERYYSWSWVSPIRHVSFIF